MAIYSVMYKRWFDTQQKLMLVSDDLEADAMAQTPSGGLELYNIGRDQLGPAKLAVLTLPMGMWIMGERKRGDVPWVIEGVATSKVQV